MQNDLGISKWDLARAINLCKRVMKGDEDAQYRFYVAMPESVDQLLRKCFRKLWEAPPKTEGENYIESFLKTTLVTMRLQPY